jgi:hypothetical protein
MKFVAIYNSETGEITALCALPPDADAPSPGMQMRPGESRAEFEAPEEFSIEQNDPQLRARMDQIIKEYRLERPGDVKVVRKTGTSY